MRINKLKRAISRGEPVFGLFVSIPHPIIVEMIGHAEYDFVIIDYEHTSTNLETIEHMVRAAELLDITPLVRISRVDRIEILKMLDCGAQGIVIPHVESKEQVEEAVRYAYYHPVGARSLNSGRPGAFAKHSLTDYIAAANGEIMIIPMIESVEGVANCESIMAVPNVSFVLEGAADLSQSLGLPWDTDHPRVQQSLDTIFEASQRCRVPYAIVSRTVDQHRRWAERGVHIYVLGDDRNTAFRAYRSKKDQYQSAAGGK
jgi:staphyloferrin B biosynthesis citrate synthase